MSEHRFSEEEAARILQRAVEGRPKVGLPDGVSMAELELVGREMGLDPDAVRLAAERARRDQAMDGGQAGFVGAPSQYEVDRLLEGELNEAGWTAAVAEMEQVYGAGNTEGRVWRRETNSGWVSLVATPYGGRTLLRFGAHVDPGLLFAMLGMAAATFVVAATVFGNIPMPDSVLIGLALLLVGTAALAFRHFVRAWYRADREKAGAVLASIEERLGVEPPANSWARAEVRGDDAQDVHA